MKKRMSAMVMGAGGIGCPAILALAQSGVRKICMVDNDHVEASNLPRQLWHLPGDIGKPKVDSAYEKLRELFPKVSFEPLFLRVDEGNAAGLFATQDVVVDATDSPQSKLLFSDIAARHGHLLVSAGVAGWRGQAMRVEGGGPCLRCAFPEGVRGAVSSSLGVLGPMAGLLGFWAAALVHAPSAPRGEAFLHWVDARRWRTGILRIEKDEQCPCNEKT